MPPLIGPLLLLPLVTLLLLLLLMLLPPCVKAPKQTTAPMQHTRGEGCLSLATTSQYQEKKNILLD